MNIYDEAYALAKALKESDEQKRNMLPMDVTFEVSKDDRSRDVSDVQP